MLNLPDKLKWPEQRTIVPRTYHEPSLCLPGNIPQHRVFLILMVFAQELPGQY